MLGLRRFASKSPPPGPGKNVTAGAPPGPDGQRMRLAARPHRHLMPTPNPPKPMVEEKPAQHGLRGLMSRLFRAPPSAPPQAPPPPPRFKSRDLPNIGLNTSTPLKFLHTDKITPVLYWYCFDMTFVHTDFERLLPPANLRPSDTPEINFELLRARNPLNLTKWMGYFLKFGDKEQALAYYQLTLGAELCGLSLKMRFVPEAIRGLHSPVFDRLPGLPRRNHVLILGLPHGYRPTQILRVLWDYDLLDDDTLAVERLPVDRVQYGGSPFLLRFKSSDEAERFVRDFHHEIFPYSDSKVFCEVID